MHLNSKSTNPLLDRDYHWKDEKAKSQKKARCNNEEPAVICFVQVNLPSGGKLLSGKETIRKTCRKLFQRILFFILLILKYCLYFSQLT